MEIERKRKDVVLTCSEKEAGVIAAVLSYDRDDCAVSCPYLKMDVCRVDWGTQHKEACHDLATQIWKFLRPVEPGKDNAIYLSGPGWLTRYECDVFNTVAALCQEPRREITIAPADLCEAIHGKPQGTDRIIEINRIIRKLALTKRDTKNSILLGCAHDLLDVELVMMPDNFWGMRIMCPSVERLEFEDIVYLGGCTGRFYPQ